MDHASSRIFTLTSLPDAAAERADCAARARGQRFTGDMPLAYSGRVFGLIVRFRLPGGDAPVLRLLWTRDGGNWRITVYDVELP
jgi:hypothetical protein